MKLRHLLLSNLIAALLLCSIVSAQATEADIELQKAQDKVNKWRGHTERLSNNVLEDAKSLAAGEQALYLALLAKLWSKSDKEESRVYLNRSGEKLVSAMAISDRKEFDKQLKFFPDTFKTLFSFDQQFSENLLKKFEKSLLDAANGKVIPDPQMGELYVSVGKQTVKANPKFAAAMGKRSLEHGFPVSLPNLIGDIYQYDDGLAESLFTTALSSARTSQDPSSNTLLFNLYRVASRPLEKPFPVNHVRNAVRAFIEKLDLAASNAEINPQGCGIAYFGSSMTQPVDQYFPEFSASFRQGIQTCTPRLQPIDQARTSSVDTQGLSVDKLLDLARNTSEKETKFYLYREVFNKLYESEDFETLSSLLDGFDGDDYRKFAPIGWNNWRIRTSAAYALAQFESGDVGAAQRTIEKTPQNLRPYVRKQVTSNKAVAENAEFHLENLNLMIKELQALDTLVDKTPEAFLYLIKEFLKITPTESIVMMRDAVKAINKADAENPDNMIEKDWAVYELFVELDAELLEVDETGTFSALKDLSSKQSRLRLTLGLLSTSLPKLVEAKKDLDQLIKSGKIKIP